MEEVVGIWIYWNEEYRPDLGRIRILGNYEPGI